MSFQDDRDDPSRPWCPPVDVYRSGHCYVVKADVPGMSQESISVKKLGNTLSISGCREFAPGEDAEEHLRLERLHGKFICELHLPGMTPGEQMDVDYKDGVLEIDVPFR